AEKVKKMHIQLSLRRKRVTLALRVTRKAQTSGIGLHSKRNNVGRFDNLQTNYISVEKSEMLQVAIAKT
ncbi:MAG: hypothetical protein PVG70_12705, partial [Desulfobacterales bacterium]